MCIDKDLFITNPSLFIKNFACNCSSDFSFLNFLLKIDCMEDLKKEIALKAKEYDENSSKIITLYVEEKINNEK